MGTYEELMPEIGEVFTLPRDLGGSRLITVVNFSLNEVGLPVDIACGGTLLPP